ncbi:hypothetical protein [Vreelandella profundi]|uniref:hypothetical protein n=1 Tax=Vreelandella profundi TaxID=2852117 RepID=UPI001F2DAF4F|nr:hypothetical protein [Halomonas profundi]
MASSRFLLLILIIISGYIFISNYTYTRGKIARANGQHLYLKSAVCGFFLFSTSYLLKHLYSDSIAYQYTLNLFASVFEEETDRLTHTAILSLTLSLYLLILLQLPVYWVEPLIKSRLIDSVLLRLRKKHKNKTINYLIRKIDVLWATFQYLSLSYVKWLQKKALGGNPVDELLLQLMSGDGGAIMTCDEHGKVFIGFVLRMPDPVLPPEERVVSIAPIMSGSMCKEFQQLHITTDYTDAFYTYHNKILDHQNIEDIAALVFTKRIKILRRFDIELFDNFFKRKVCACGHDIYLPRPHRQNVPIATSK